MFIIYIGKKREGVIVINRSLPPCKGKNTYI